ncbi:MAG TPA: aminoacyl-tRNA hydrolase [Flavobacteriales bacterium]|nr:aminoacyl-tRNA hydrolase [Flavobacteriales bacterium]
MKYLIAGLGNPGPEYADTRHNIGFRAVEALASAHNTSFAPGRYADSASFRHKGRTFVLIKPQTFMNLSGKAVRYWLEQEGIGPDRLMVIVDDLALPFGKMRMRAAGGDGNHNGLTSIIEQLATEGFPRLRVGIGSGFARGKQVEYVLGQWSAEEQEAMPALLEQIGKAVLEFGLIGVERTMNQINKK